MTPDLEALIDLNYHYRKGHMLHSGGVGNQLSMYLDAMALIDRVYDEYAKKN